MAHEPTQCLRGDILGISLLLLAHAISDASLLAILYFEKVQYSHRDCRSMDLQSRYDGTHDVLRLQTRRSCNGARRRCR